MQKLIEPAFKMLNLKTKKRILSLTQPISNDAQLIPQWSWTQKKRRDLIRTIPRSYG